MFNKLNFLVRHIINILKTKLSQSVLENLDLSRTHSFSQDSLIQTTCLVNPLTPGTFCQNGFFFFDILVVLKLDRGQISFSLVENTLVARQLAVLVTRIAFKTFWKSALSFSTFEFFFSPFLFILGFFFAAVIGHLPGLLGVRKDFRKSH